MASSQPHAEPGGRETVEMRRGTSLALAVALVVAVAMPHTAGAVGESSWSSVNGPDDVRAIAQLTDEVVVVATDDSIHRSINGGVTWEETYPWSGLHFLGDVVQIEDIGFADEHVGWAVGRYFDSAQPLPGGDWQSLILITEDGGRTWSRQDDASGSDEPTFRGVDAHDPDTVLAVGDGGLYSISEDGGDTWETWELGWGAILDCAFADATRFVAVGVEGRIHRGYRGDFGWNTVNESEPALATHDLYGVDCTSDGYAVAVGGNEALLESHDFGEDWTKDVVEMSGFPELHAVEFLDAQVGYLAGGHLDPSFDMHPLILKTTDGGGYYGLDTPPDIGHELVAVSVLDQGEMWASSTDTQLHLARTTLERVAGANRYETAVEISREVFPDGGADQAVIATGKGYADALAAAGIAGVAGGPLLLVGNTLPSSVAAELDRLGVTHVYIVGGVGVVPSGVESALSAAGVTVTRLAGVDRYDTARVVAQEVAAELGAAWHHMVFIARGDDFPDALALAPFAYSQQVPILLVKPHDITAQTSGALAVLEVTDAIVAGGTAAVGEPVKDLIDTILAFNGGSASTRLAGVDRYGTAAVIDDHALFRGWGEGSFIGVASGEGFADALAGGVAAGAMYGSMVLSRRTSLPSASRGHVFVYSQNSTDVRVFGGTAAVSKDAMDALEGLY
jgi:putative cell wall-binding protein/photosystem II stability/assembly factor-like uncharacterized protein